jgi:hypothetical protein
MFWKGGIVRQDRLQNNQSNQIGIIETTILTKKKVSSPAIQ